MTYLASALAAAVLVLLAALAGAIAAWRRTDRTNTSLSLRCAHQKGRIRSLRAENTLLAEAYDRLSRERDELKARQGLRLPRWGRQTLIDIARANSPADFDRKDNR